MVDAYQTHVDALNREGAKITGYGDFTVPVNALTPSQMEGIYDLAFILVKQTHNEETIRELLPHLKDDSIVCTLQNGVPEPAIDELVGGHRTVGGACRWGATFIGPGVVEQTNSLSVMDGGKVEVTGNLIGARWLKLMLNSCMSGLSAALGSTFEVVLNSDKAMACTAYIAAGVVHTARACGCKPTDTNGLNTAEIADFTTAAELERSKGYIYRNYYPLRTAKASMLQDIEKGKKTEVNMINGYTCQAGRKVGIPTPFNDLVVKIITEVEEGKRKAEPANLDLFTLPELN